MKNHCTTLQKSSFNVFGFHLFLVGEVAVSQEVYRDIEESRGNACVT